MQDMMQSAMDNSNGNGNNGNNESNLQNNESTDTPGLVNGIETGRKFGSNTVEYFA
jgi:hypothetical protein